MRAITSLQCWQLFLLAILQAIWFWIHYRFDWISAEQGSGFWLLSYVILSPQCSTLITASILFRYLPMSKELTSLLGPVGGQCLQLAIGKYEFSYRFQWLVNSNFVGFLVWSLFWIYLAKFAEQIPYVLDRPGRDKKRK